MTQKEMQAMLLEMTAKLDALEKENSELKKGVVTAPAPKDNVVMDVKDNMLTITIDLSKDYGVSTSGKSIIVGSTEGNKKLAGTDIYVGLNVYKKNPDFKETADSKKKTAKK
jgi:hypothetical protein